MTLNFEAELWIYSGSASWYFVTVPRETSALIRDEIAVKLRRGFGSVKVEVRCGDTRWRTSIFPDKESKCYVLPIKSLVRKSEILVVGQLIEFSLETISLESIE